MDKLAALLRPHQVCMRINGGGANLRMSGARLGIVAMGILGIEHILSALVILHVLHAEPSVQFLRREPQLLGYLRGSVARDGAEHIDGIEGIIEEISRSYSCFATTAQVSLSSTFCEAILASSSPILVFS